MNQPPVPSTPPPRQELLDLNPGETANSHEAANTGHESQAPEGARGEESGAKDAPEKGAVHVSPIGENWDIESEAGTLGQAETKTEAVELAKSLAKETGAPKVIVHGSDGSIEQDLPIE